MATKKSGDKRKSLVRNLPTTEVDITTLIPHPRNPNEREDVSDIMDALSEYGLYRPIIVQKSSNYILAQNHVWLAARRLGWDKIEALFLDVDDTTALRILVNDNKTQEGARINDRLVAEILSSIPDPHIGTGFSPEEVADLSKLVAEQVAQASQALSDYTAKMPDPLADSVTSGTRTEPRDHREDLLAASQERRGTGAPPMSEDKDVEEIEEDEPTVSVRAELQATLELREQELYIGKNRWGIADLRDDMLVEVLPDPIKTWGGWQVTPDDGKTHWLYQYSLGGAKNLPLDRTILSFFTYDNKFENWYQLPAYYTAKFLTGGLTMAVTPDFSFYSDNARCHHMYSQMKAQWCARFFQEAGIKVIPRLQFDFTDPDTLEIGMLGQVVGAPVLATSQQNAKPEDAEKVIKCLREGLDYLKPQTLLYYSGPPGRRMMEQVGWQGNVVYVENYAAVRRGVAFDKKDGLASKEAEAYRKTLAAKRRENAKAKNTRDDDSNDAD